MRGIFLVVRLGVSQKGIIPAGAGHFRGTPARRALIRDHPRRCGAFAWAFDSEKGAAGSSPQVRGIWCRRFRLGARRGIIPAGAGHFAWRPVFGLMGRDHPRRCGAFTPKASATGMSSGSSPQVRGISAGGGVGMKTLRIIPAGAGHLHLPQASRGK